MHLWTTLVYLVMLTTAAMAQNMRESSYPISNQGVLDSSMIAKRFQGYRPRRTRIRPPHSPISVSEGPRGTLDVASHRYHRILTNDLKHLDGLGKNAPLDKEILNFLDSDLTRMVKDIDFDPYWRLFDTMDLMVPKLRTAFIRMTNSNRELATQILNFLDYAALF